MTVRIHSPVLAIAMVLPIITSSCSASHATAPSASVSSTSATSTRTSTPGKSPTTVALPQAPAFTPAPATPTQEPLLSTGPYVAYLRGDDGLYYAVLSDITGPGKQSVPLPSDVADQIRYDGWASNSAAHISPDGKYFAYETGRSEPPYDLQLRIIRLEDQEQVASIPLLRKDMNAATSELAAAAADALGDYLSDVPRELWEDELLFSIQAGIRTFQWSPIRPILAFVAQIDGPSTDLYVIDPSDPNPVRITAGLQNVQRLDWSPNGEWIAHGAAYIVGMGTPIDNYIVSRDGWTLLDLPDGGLQASGWVTSDYYLVNEAANGPGSFRLSAVRMPEPAFKVLWRGTFSSFALDLPNDTLIVSVDEPWDYGTAPGTYLVRMNTHSSSRIADSLGSITTWGRGADRFLGVADGVFSISLDGRLRQILDRPAAVSVSPDREMVALYPRSAESPTVLYDARLGRAREVFNGDVTCIEWAPDSLSFLVVSEQSLFSIDVSTTDVTQLADGLVTDGFTCPIVIVAK